MKSVCCATLSLLLALCIADLSSSLPPANRSPPAGPACCTVDQWESGVGYAFGGSGAGPYVSGYGKISFDYKNQKLAQNQTFIGTDGKKISQQTVMDGRTHKMYMVDQTGHCTIGSMPSGIPRQCVPDYFKYVATITYGSPGASFNGLVFQARVTGGSNVTLVMTQRQCAPAFQMAQQPNPNTMITQSFFNLTNGIRNPSVFNIPAACRKSTADSLNDVHLTDLLASRRRYARSVRLAARPLAPFCIFGACEGV